MKTYIELSRENNKYDKEIIHIYQNFPKSYNDGFREDYWENHFDNLKKGDLSRFVIEFRYLKRLQNRHPEDNTIYRAMEIIKYLLEENKEILESFPHVFPFHGVQETITNIKEVKEYFFTEEAFGPYKKGCDNLSQPNVYKTASFEVGKYKKRAWQRTGIKDATHIGCYFDSRYLNDRFIKRDYVEDIFERDCSSHRNMHIFKFVIKPIIFAIKLTNIEEAKKKNDFYKLGLFN